MKKADSSSTSHNQKATKKQPKHKLQPKTHPEKLW